LHGGVLGIEAQPWIRLRKTRIVASQDPRHARTRSIAVLTATLWSALPILSTMHPRWPRSFNA
jgi:hypothetical protein